jgi:hypothetical protein
MAKLYVNPHRPTLDSNNKVIPGAQAWFTLESTDVPSTAYSDEALTVPLPNPVVANAIGRWPDISLREDITYRVRPVHRGAGGHAFAFRLGRPNGQ